MSGTMKIHVICDAQAEEDRQERVQGSGSAVCVRGRRLSGIWFSSPCQRQEDVQGATLGKSTHHQLLLSSHRYLLISRKMMDRGLSRSGEVRVRKVHARGV